MIWIESSVGPASADPEGRQGVRTPPGKLQVIWVSIGDKQLDPLEKVGPPWKKLDTPPPPPPKKKKKKKKMLDPLWNLRKL